MSRCFQQGSVHLRSCKDGQPPPLRAAPRRVLRVRASGDAPQEEKPPVKETTAQRATRRLVKRTYDAESARKARPDCAGLTPCRRSTAPPRAASPLAHSVAKLILRPRPPFPQVLKKLNDLGVTQPEQLKRVFLQSGVSKLLPRAVCGEALAYLCSPKLTRSPWRLGVSRSQSRRVFHSLLCVRLGAKRPRVRQRKLNRSRRVRPTHSFLAAWASSSACWSPCSSLSA